MLISNISMEGISPALPGMQQRSSLYGTYPASWAHLAPSLTSTDLFEERADAPADAPRRPDAIYLYGVDVMSTADIKQYFGDYAPRFVEWINDSSCGWLGREGWRWFGKTVSFCGVRLLIACEALWMVASTEGHRPSKLP